MVRTQVQLTEAQVAHLRRLSAESGKSISALIRDAVDRMAPSDLEERWQRARSVIGKYRDREGASDIAENHDEYLAEAFLDWRSS